MLRDTITTHQPIIVSTTFSEIHGAKEVVNLLIQKKWVACAQIFSIESQFIWKEKLESTPEILVQLKTVRSLYQEVESMIRNNHSYEIPEIIATPIIEISQAYLQWMLSQLDLDTKTQYV
jgi:periplasmic divalent cation tolerance protein